MASRCVLTKPTAPPRFSICTICGGPGGGPEHVDRPTVACIACMRHHHLACLCIIPQDPLDFTCARCLIRNDGIGIPARSSLETQDSAVHLPLVRPTDKMFGLSGASDNPFLPTADESSPATRSRCTAPGCQEVAASGYPACFFHMQPVSPKLPKSIDRQHVPVAVQPNGRLPEGPAQNRKQLDAKVTARKSIAAKPAFLLTASKPNGIRLNGSTQSILNRVGSNGSHLSPKSSLLRQIHPELPETPSRKRQRMTSPGNGEFGPRVSQRNFDLPSKERSPPYGNPPSRNFGSPLPNGSNGLWCLDKDKGRGAAQAPRLDTNFSQPPTSEVNFDFGPAATPARNASSNDTRKAGLAGSFPEPTILSHTDWRSPSARNSTAPEKQSRGPAPLKAKKHQKIAKSAYGGLMPVIRPPPLEKQRQRLTESHDISALDSFIYGQEGSSRPPPGVVATAQHEPQKRGDVFYGHIDPRTHWTRPRSGEWYQKKEEEIKARGGRKANFGKAAQRMREQRLKESPDEWEENLPDRVRNDEAWLGAMRFHHSRIHGVQMDHTPQASEQQPPVRKKRAYRRRNQGLVPPVVPESSGAGARLNSQAPNAGPGLQPAAGANSSPKLQKKQAGTSI